MSESNTADYSKMKVADLKKELKAKGLSTVGNKNELLERLQSGVPSQSSGDADNASDHDLLDEDEVLGEDGLDDELSVEGMSENIDLSTVDENQITSNSSENKSSPLKRKIDASKESQNGSQPKKITLNRFTSISAHSEKENQNETEKQSEEKESTEPEKKIVKISSFSVKERLELRAQKFGVPLSDAAKKEARAARFGISGSQPSNQVATTEVLKKRAERFGATVSPHLQKTELNDKKKSRAERFGLTSSTPSATDKSSLDEKKKLRAERFKLNNV
ncbi:hypothetical protein LSTR_LSTR002864 [Laodelphax striatellus]|uniref:SAP domain-containing protein n=1 Tax=Laodelphax striatellus TaxID=195883 RepID=A0A482XJG9_LAOST|nr:hypothetical protein LSTR_LSTR002864 [Laodelphax striatellus]